MKYYAGIGSRFATKEILNICYDYGKILAKNNYILRSGHADGCDIAFENGCDLINDEKEELKEIFLPWKNFNGSDSIHYFVNHIPENIEKITKENYPLWYNSSIAVKYLHARNTQQILGENADNYSDFVVCYSDRSYDDPAKIGGTMYGIKLAMKYKIPVFNLYLENQRIMFKEFIDNIS